MSAGTTGSISTDVIAMGNAQNKMQEIYGELNSAVNSLGEQQSTLAANWSGEASSQFGQALTNFMEDFGRINSALVSMMETLGQNTHIYVNTNDTSTAMAQAFTNTTSGMLTPGSLTGALQAGGLAGF
jgi:WXG100 family type VII secretion target